MTVLCAETRAAVLRECLIRKITTFTFGTPLTSSPSSKNVGKLISLTTSNTSYTQNLTYDTFARPITEQITTDTSYQYDYTYDAQTGLPSTMTYPVSTSGYRFKLQYDYAYGQIARVKRFDSPNTEYWKFNTIDARGNVLTEDLGNGVKVTSGFNPLTGLLESRQSGPGGGTAIQNLTYQWSNNGNLTRRQDLRQSLTEVFTYDSLERLDVTTLNSTPTQDVEYSAIGNIMKMDAGASNWTYDATRKHAVTVAGSNTFAYDADGNMQTRTGSAVTWFSYNLPNKIDGSGGVSSQFTYDPLRSRVKQEATYTTGTETTHYIGGLMEKVVTPSNTQYRHYIATPTGFVGLYTRRISGVLEDTFYFTKDHLGSIDSITNASGAIQVRLSYDTFGKRRKEAGWSGIVPAADWTAIENTTRRGYTGHEHLDNLGLIHMNGRVQDPTIGRFLSADPFVPNPFSGQSFNRYSYVANNPLSFIDPSGFTETQPDDPNDDPNECNPSFGIYFDFSWIFMPGLDARRLISRSNPYAGPAGGGAALGPEYLDTRSTVSGSLFFSPPQVTRQFGPDREDVETATNAANVFFDAARIRQGEGLGMWLGANGQYYREGWGGNGATGARKVALANRAVLGAVGRFLGYLGVGQSIADIAVDIQTNSDQLQLLEHSTDLGIGLYGLYGGVPGALAGGTYFIGKTTGLNDAIMRSRRPLVEAQLDVLKYRVPSDCMCGL